ncbi:malto-oligosyltrehalose trehalohydrolase [Sphingobacterium deserti]|uniref:Malto-oligosyltrehalose trehalohydrolase n=1 Tax=Sphingobacterium deserti TaxID=1229276 RepID=A0A0B8T2H6_9SPHI|nr:malto-oligosyltrehalose trehalohydrolase [Sphingobacterium deserti]KGE13048.1 malto-oligosyltrehalose trehalohydrolase [Sphingobacterium deserti]
MFETGVNNIGVSLRNGTAHINVWAPDAKSVICRVEKRGADIPLAIGKYGYWYAESDALKEGDSYRFQIDGEPYPDPASLAQPEGVHGASQIVDLQYPWRDENYHPPALDKLIIYELHVGTFTASHDFSGVIERIPHLLKLGINAIEIMPVAQFPGDRNWGYDGVFLFAVQHSYGGAKGLQQLVDACHEAGIAVILDVVYNHFGPEGNYLPNFGPYFTEKYSTPWGKAINYDDAYSHGVRDFVLANIRMWFEDFHIDGLRLDAVHAIKDFSPKHILQEVRQLTDDIIAARKKPHYLIVECDLNDRRYLDPLQNNAFAMDAQWIDEFHHALRVAAGEEKKGYYKDFNGLEDLAKAYEKAYVFDGNYSTHREKFFGTSAAGLSGERFIVFSQNHDQVGNRMLGERSAALYSKSVQRLMAMAVILSPYTPMLFMGEEWGTEKPFQYFVSHGDEELIEAVREGRKAEFADFQSEGTPPDPQATATFNTCVLDWNEVEADTQQKMLNYYTKLIKLRRELQASGSFGREQLAVEHDKEKDSILLTMGSGKNQMLAILNFSAETQSYEVDGQWKIMLDSNDRQWAGDSNMGDAVDSSVTVASTSGILLALVSA